MEVSFRDIIERTETGPYCSEKQWDTERIPSKLKEIVKEHGLENTYDGENPINADDGLADEYFQAGNHNGIVPTRANAHKSVLRSIGPGDCPLMGAARVVEPPIKAINSRAKFCEVI